jgi:protein-disulfide isomerase
MLPAVGQKFLQARNRLPRRDGIDGNAEEPDSVHKERIPEITGEDRAEYGYNPGVTRLRFLATGALLVVLAACTVQGQDILEDVTDEASSSSVSSDSASNQLGERPVNDGVEIGGANAPVTMDLFLNYDSPYSRQFHTLMPALQVNFIEKGTLKLRIFPAAFAKYPDSAKKASMLRCAAAQGKGLAMHGLLITGSETLLPAGMDRAVHESCMSQPAPVVASTAQERGVTVVPTYVINGKTFTGVPTEADLLGAIRENL